MTIDDVMLMAYVDGDLPAERRAEVEAAAAESSEVAARLKAMRASALPYGAAFERQALPPVPPALLERIAELTRVSARPHPVVARREAVWPRLAAAFFVGVLCAGGAVKLWSARAPAALASAGTPWIDAVAEYQQLYSRETLAEVVEDRGLTEKIVARLRSTDAMPLRVPDLRAAGLTFKRIQRLNFHDQAVAQIVYLPEHGGPIALCVTRESGPDEAPSAKQVGEMQAVAWRHDRLGYVLLGKGADVDLDALAKRIAENGSSALYGLAVAPAHGDEASFPG